MPHPTSVFVRPAPGLRIADPQTGDYLPGSGRLVPRSGFWLRRLKDGDVFAAEQTSPVVEQTSPFAEHDVPKADEGGA